MAMYRRRPAYRKKRAAARRQRRYRKASPKYPTFTETIEAGFVQVGNGGLWQTQFNSLPQNVPYSQLYKQFCIKKLQVILLPSYNSADAALLTSGTELARLAFAIDDTPSVQVPTSELDVITANGSKIVSAAKKIVINCRPKPDLMAVGDIKPTPAHVATRIRGNVWLNTDNSAVTNSGTAVPHGSIRYWLSGAPMSLAYTQFTVYYKVTFSLRDPA